MKIWKRNAVIAYGRHYILLSCDTPTKTKFQIGKEVHVFQEVFFFHLPA